MKRNSIASILLLTLLLSLTGTKAFGYDIEVKNKHGVTIYYSYINNNTELEVKGSSGTYYGTIIIPEEVTFMNRTRKVTSIGYGAFKSCTSLTSITIPNSVTTIGEKAFRECTGLTNITIPNSVTTIGQESFYGCTGLKNVSIGNSVTTIGEEAFYNCTGLTSLIIPNSVTTIGKSAFSGCKGLTSVTIPNSVTAISYSAFSGCSGLTSITIPNSVATIGEYAFSGCKGLKSVTIPNSVTRIGNGTFYSCSSLTSVTIPNSVTTIGESAFEICFSLTSVTIGNSVTTIGERTFYRCSGLTSITIGNSVTTIGKMAFGLCGLKSLIIPNSVTTIGEWSFYNCDDLTSVTIGNSVTTIGERAFSGCSGLTSVTIGRSVTKISSLAFENADIPTIISLIEEPFGIAGKSSNYNYQVFTLNTFNNATLYVPKGTIEKYKATEGWKDFLFMEEGTGPGGDNPPEPQQCAKPTINYENGKLNIISETEGAVCYYSTGAATLNAKDYTSFNEDSNLSDQIQLFVYAYATADGYEDSETVSKQIYLPVGKVTEVHDTTFINVEVHDTTFVNVEVHDTTFVNVEVHDTTFVNVEVHDTTFVDVPYEVLIVDTINVPTTQEIPAPTIVVDNGTVEILSGLENAIIYYTVDGTTPTVSEENRYTGPFSLTGDCTIHAIAVLKSDAAAKEVIDGIWRPSQTATLRYFRANGIETDNPTSGVNIIVTQSADGKQKVIKWIKR